MKRDMDVIRDLVLALEAMPTSLGGIYSIPYDDETFTNTGHSIEQIEYHLRQLALANYIDSADSRTMAISGFIFRGFTPEGHDFVDSIRDPFIWKKTKDGALAAGGWTVDLLKDLAKGFIKKQIKKLADVDL